MTLTDELLALTLSRIEANIAKLDSQLQCVRVALGEIQGGMQMLIEAHAEEDEDETDDEATHDTTTDDGSDTDMSYIVEDHTSSSASYDSDDD